MRKLFGEPWRQRGSAIRIDVLAFPLNGEAVHQAARLDTFPPLPPPPPKKNIMENGNLQTMEVVMARGSWKKRIDKQFVSRTIPIMTPIGSTTKTYKAAG